MIINLGDSILILIFIKTIVFKKEVYSLDFNLKLDSEHGYEVYINILNISWINVNQFPMFIKEKTKKDKNKWTVFTILLTWNYSYL